MTKPATVQSFRPVAAWQWLGLLPIAIVGCTGAFILVGLAGSPQWLWAYAIMALPTIVTLCLLFDFRRSAIHLGPSGLRYDAVGYVAQAPWSAISRTGNGKALLLDPPDVRIKAWLGGMARVVAVLLPYQERRAAPRMRCASYRCTCSMTAD